MLNTERCNDYLATVRAFADSTGQREQLEKKLAHLAEMFDDKAGSGALAQTVLFKDFAPHSFEFICQQRRGAGEWFTVMNGGLIYHGRHDNGGDGGAPTYSVSLSPSNGWQIHT